MPELVNDFSTLADKQRHALAAVYDSDNNVVKGMREAGYKDAAEPQLKITFKRILKRKDAQDYVNHIKNDPKFLQEELQWFRQPKTLYQNQYDNRLIPTTLTDENKSFLDYYFITGDKFRAMKEAFPNEWNESNKAISLKKASRILSNESSIKYMNMLNDRSLQEIFLSKSKIIKEVYELAKDCSDSKSRFAAVKAYELLARMTGLLQDKNSVNVSDGGKIEINYIIPDKIDTKLTEDINLFIKENKDKTYTDIEYQQFQKDDE
jgi:hypothetical protein